MKILFNTLSVSEHVIGASPDISSQSRKRVTVQCPSCESTREAFVFNLTNVGHAQCQRCTAKSYSPTIAGSLYWIENKSLGLFKVGISNNVEKRLAPFLKKGWTIRTIENFDSGYDALELETAILGVLRQAEAFTASEDALEGVQYRSGMTEMFNRTNGATRVVNRFISAYQPKGSPAHSSDANNSQLADLIAAA